MSLGESDYSPQISEWLCLNADEGALAAFNAASPQERARFIHRFEGALENQGGTLIERPAHVKRHGNQVRRRRFRRFRAVELIG